jgi:two-component system NtrC family sensor kinase
MDFHRFKVRLIASLVLISSIPLLFFALVIYRREAELVRRKALSHLESIVLQNSLTIKEFKEERIHDLNLLAKTVKGYGKKSQTKHFKHLQAERKLYRHLFLIDCTGAILLQTGPLGVPRDGLREQEWFTSALKGKAFLGDVDFRSPRGAHDLLAAVPIKSTQGLVIGILGAIVDFQEVANAIKSIGIGSTGEIYLLNKDGVFLTSTRVGENPPGQKLGPERFTDYFVEVAPHEFIDYRGKRVIRVYRELSDFNWVLVGEQDSNEVLSDIASLRTMFAAFVALLIILVAATGRLISARMVRLLETAYEQNKELELQVIQKDKLASMGLLTAGIAHELNTPLASALLYTQMLKEDVGKSETSFRERLTFIEEEIKRGSRIIRNLLDFSRKSQTDTTMTNINEVVQKLLDISHKLCSHRGIEVRRALEKGLPLVKGNTGVLHQVFMNIVANAVEAMENGGTLTVTTRFVNTLHRVVVEIGDTGSGIPEEHLGNVFDPFFTTKPSEEGTGLGLAISYSMVKKMGGNIRVSSTCSRQTDSTVPATGTTFTIELPVQERDSQTEGDNRRLTT